MTKKTVLFSFDLEEFDMPMEYGFNISFKDQIEISRAGTERVLTILERFKIQATFFTTSVYALENEAMIRKMVEISHEVASHSYYHSKFSIEDLKNSKTKLEEITGKKVTGFRMPRMKEVDHDELSKAGYLYDSSLNPVYLPGRYNHLNKPRTIFKKNNLWIIPAAASPAIRVPLFWLSFHHFPLFIYKQLVSKTIDKDEHVVLYFHPWEFCELKGKYGLPAFTTKNSGQKMIDRFTSLIDWMNKMGYEFQTIQSYLDQRLIKT